MIKNFINRLMLLADSGKLFKTPFQWLYLLIGASAFAPFGIYLYFWIRYWDRSVDLLMPNFWGEFVSVFMLILFGYVVLLTGWALFVFWNNRRQNLDSTVETGNRLTAIPLVTDLIQSSGEALSLYIVIIPSAGAALAYIACLLTNGFGFYTEYAFWWMTLGVPCVFAAAGVAGYLNLLATRYVAERIRVIAQIGNDVHKLSIGAPREATREADNRDAHFAMPAVSRGEKLTVIIGLAAAALTALAIALSVSLITYKATGKPLSEEIPERYISKVERQYADFGRFYSNVRATYDQLGEEQQKAYAGLSYKRLYRYTYDYYLNDGYRQKTGEEAAAAYESDVHQPAMEKVKAEVAKWEQYKVDHDVNTYISVSTVSTTGKEKRGKKETVRPAYYFNVTMPRGELLDASVTYRPRKGGKAAAPGIKPVTTNLSGLRKYSAEEPALYKTGKPDLWNSYSMEVTVNSVTLVDGTVIRPADLKKVPETVTRYTADPNPKNEKAMILKYADRHYPSVETFMRRRTEELLQAQDSLCYSFLH
ncbi:MAG: hypothetical protein IJV55_00685 [Paludibacteraceae bacterium]|nr:hypothetical protein [Paludibacteraceae bacterium]